MVSPMSTESTPDKTASFGYRDVPEGERQGLVNEVFRNVATRYDVMNDAMSFGLHRLWKEGLVSALNPPRGDKPFRVLDMAGGTGDVTRRIVRAGGPGTSAVLGDISPEMLGVARENVEKWGLSHRIEIVEANAEALPFTDKSFEAYTIAFGIRNVTHIDRALAEAFRVLKVGGRLLVLEFSHVDLPVLDRLYDFHSFEVIPRLGRAIAGDAQPYRYLVESIRKFPKPDAFADMIGQAGFARGTWRGMTGGVAALHSGWKV
jgi:demethylmenaquinone methyltransferase / 2-methoxy-6-polyprenyl-1,4-benzoquinol methylase